MHTAALLTLRSLFVVLAFLAGLFAICAVWYLGAALFDGATHERVGAAFLFTTGAIFLAAALIPLARPLFAPRGRYRHTG